MKNLPDRFPIRYAILVEDNLHEDKEDDFDEAKRNVLWDKLLEFLQTTPLKVDDLNLRYRTVSLSYGRTQLADIPELNVPESWTENLTKELKKSIPTGAFGSSSGKAFELGLYSYRGSLEVPLFWRIYAHKDNKAYMDDRLGLDRTGMLNYPAFGDKVYKQYQQIMRGDVAGLERLKSSEEMHPVSYLTIPNSPLWHALDQGQNDGLINPGADADDTNDEVKKGKPEKRPSKISVVVARNLNALLREEMLALHKIASFCNNCGNVLPFAYKGKYCPESPDTADCIRERAKMRARASSQK